MGTLEQTIANAAKSGGSSAPRDGETRLVAVELLDDNPFQPRVSMDAAELNELAASIASKGQIQAIVVRPKADGRFIVVAGHRRVAAFKRLQETDSQKYARINATVRLALEDADLASLAYAENVTRSGLTAVEEGRALERMVDAGLAKTNEELATLTNQPLQKIRRLRRLARAPKVIKDAIETGLMVVVGKDDAGEPHEERRRLDMMAGLELLKLLEHLKASPKPQKAEERTASAVKRALAQNWSFTRTSEFVSAVIEGKQKVEDATAPEDTNAPDAAVFERSARRFSVDLKRLAGASDAQLEALRKAFDDLLSSRSAQA